MTQVKKSRTPTAPMSLKIDIPPSELMKPRITIFGVGGAGGNAVNNMIRSNLEGVEFIAANTDSQALENSLAKVRIQLGVKTTKGLGAGSFPDRGKAAAEENLEEIERYIEGNNMIFIAAGMGGGTGTGAAPVIAQMAHERDILTVGVVTKPFHFEGKYRMETAEKGIEELKKHVDTLIVIPNQNLFRIANEHTTFESAFKMADDVLHAGVRGVTDLITMPGLVNLDFADIRTIMTKMGKAMMGTGEASGENRAIAACEAAISNPLLDDISIKGAKGVLVNMTGGPDMTLFEADIAVNTIKKEVDPNANIIFGSAFNENMKGKIRISVVATGIDIEEFRRESFRSHESQEPSRFRANLAREEIVKKLIEPKQESPIIVETKSFFDPGSISKPANEELEEISDANFTPKRSYAKEENLNYGKEELRAKSHEEYSEEFTQISFFGNEVEDKLSENDALEVEQEKPVSKKDKVEKPVKPTKPSTKSNSTKKKESSGFGLFSFMNSVKSREVNEDEAEEPELIEEEISAAEEIKQEKPRIEFPHKTEIDQTLEHSASELFRPKLIRSQAAEKKRQEFFGSTIFDEKDSVKESDKIDEDIFNVPAFFRRKK